MSDFKKLKSINYNDILDKKELKKNLEENFGKDLIYISGDAYETFAHMTKYGENIGFKGDFQAMNMLTGELFESHAAFLPKGLTESLERILDKNGVVELKVMVQIMQSDKNSDGFAWIAEQPQTEERQARSQELRRNFLGEIQGFQALPSPEKKKA